METFFRTADAFDKHCRGCVNNNKDIMITMVEEKDSKPIFNDYFLTTEQAIYLKNRIERALASNQE